MHILDPDVRAVREGRASYRAEPELFPAELVLRDLRTTPDSGAARRVLARYAVLRACLLAADPKAEPALVDHATVTARAYLRASPAGWRERGFLRRLLRVTMTRDAIPLLVRAADAADRDGYVHGGVALRSAARRLALPSIPVGWTRPSTS
jgi:hypothetical protein